ALRSRVRSSNTARHTASDRETLKPCRCDNSRATRSAAATASFVITIDFGAERILPGYNVRRPAPGRLPPCPLTVGVDIGLIVGHNPITRQLHETEDTGE